MKEDLFHEFNPVSAKQWKQKIQFDLKGADYNDTLLWKSLEGIDVAPFYHQDNFEALKIPESSQVFSVCQTIFVTEVQTANFLAKDAIVRGATSIQFEAHEAFDIDKLCAGLTIPEGGSIHFRLNFLSSQFLLDLLEKTQEFSVYLNLDPIAQLASTGNWYSNGKKDLELVGKLLKTAPFNTNIISVDTGIYQNAGANCVQQVAYALAHVNEYFHRFEEAGIVFDTITKIPFQFAVGGNYFFEIAKLRAFRHLFQLLCETHKVAINPIIFAQPSLRNKTIYDYNVNMLRTTTECMSAMLGGADLISNIAYDTIYHKKNEFGERIARNQLLILQQESYFLEAASFSEGAYYIEQLTAQIAEKALEIFKELEKGGGFLAQLNEGTIQRKIAESAEKEQEQFDTGNMVLLGSNKHPNQGDIMKDNIELYPFIKMKPRKTLIKPIIKKRLTETLEQERLLKEEESS